MELQHSDSTDSHAVQLFGDHQQLAPHDVRVEGLPRKEAEQLPVAGSLQWTDRQGSPATSGQGPVSGKVPTGS
jgi:hypothetical protein